ncbi:gluconokinase [Cryobacterium aureum]|uniref:gluconokinase n=1 Tax=Cryobacterium aureum TaxID=995037 RepID=UPI000CF43985|nr:gluconokinase [Cryobacterium aureum]
MKQTEEIQSIVVMGVSGSGKSTVGVLLARSLNFEFFDADRLHPADNIAKMATGRALTDAEREPWLHAVGGYLAHARKSDGGLVVACSALRRAYRDILRKHVADAYFVFLDGEQEIVQDRIVRRVHDFMPPSLLASQFEILEPLEADEYGICADILLAPLDVVDVITAQLHPTSKRPVVIAKGLGRALP